MRPTIPPQAAGDEPGRVDAWLEDQLIAYAKRTKNPGCEDRAIWDVFREERASLMELRGLFDGFAHPLSSELANPSAFLSRPIDITAPIIRGIFT